MEMIYVLSLAMPTLRDLLRVYRVGRKKTYCFELVTPICDENSFSSPQTSVRSGLPKYHVIDAAIDRY